MFDQISKTALLALAISVARVQAQDFTEVNVFSSSTCGSDPNDLEAQNFELSFVPETDDKGNQYSGCMSASIGLPDWPTTDNGKYDAWVDTSVLGSGCSILFYNLLGSQEEFNKWPCRSLYRKIQKDTTPCGDLDLTQDFGYA